MTERDRRGGVVRGPRGAAVAIALAAGLAVGLAVSASAQVNPGALNPVYPDDAPVARETLQRVAEFAAAGNRAQAVRELQRLLEEQGDRVVASGGNTDLYTPVRAQVHQRLLNAPELLSLYRDQEEPAARRALEAGDAAGVERSRLLTRSGLDAAVRVARRMVGEGQFEAARLALEQLETHPDRAAGGDARARADAAAAMTLVARYLDRDSAWARARRWTEEAGAAWEAPAAFPRPAALRVASRSLSTPAAAPTGEAVPARPLWSVRLEPQAMPEPAPGEMAAEPEPPADQLGDNLWVAPVAVGDTIYINDGTFVTARDRYTLQPRWTVHPVGDGTTEDLYAARRLATERSNGRQVEDVNTVSVLGRTVVATMGLARGGGREGVGVTVAIDADTGSTLWSVDVSRLDPQLDGASVRGPALLDPWGGPTLVVAARKPALGRRTVTLYLVGLDVGTGALRWVRPVASAGSIPWSRADRRIGFAPLLHEGVVYAVDPLGVMAAVEAATGRPVWVRLAPVPALMPGFSSESSTPWQWSSPIAMGSGLLTLMPDKGELVRLDLATGAMGGRLSADSLAQASYLLAVGDLVAAIGPEFATFVPADNIAGGTVRKVRIADKPGARGRVVPLRDGTGLLVPRGDGLALVPTPRTPEAAEPTVLALERTGNALPLGDQVVVLDATRLHSFLSWDAADRLLTARMDQDPADAGPAVTLAQMAFQAGKADRIAPAADRALAALERDPLSATSQKQRERLYAALLEMVESSQARWEPGEAGAAEGAAAEGPALDLPVMELVLARLGRAASRPEERVGHLVALARYHEEAQAPALAAEAYQKVLEDPALAGAQWASRGSSVRADVEATRRVRALAEAHGARAYGAFEAEAARRLAALPEGAGVEALSALARAFPASTSASSAWARVADAHEAAGRGAEAVGALREALAAAEASAVGGAGGPEAETRLGEAAGRLVGTLRRQDKSFAAAQVLQRLRERRPGLALTDRGSAVDAEAALVEARERLAGLRRLPRVGPKIVGEAQPLAGWSVMMPRSRRSLERAAEQVMLTSGSRLQIGLFGSSVGGGAGTAGGAGLEPLWTRSYTGSAPVLLRYDAETVDLLWPSAPDAAPAEARGDGPVMERVGAIDGRTRFFTPALRTALAAVPRRPPPPGDPVDPVRREGLVSAGDEQVLVLAERAGRVVGFDAATGKTLWARSVALNLVSDVVVGGGAIVVGGVVGDPVQGAARVRSAALVLDPRTGETVRRFDDLPGRLRLLRLAEGEGGGGAAGGGAPAVIAATGAVVASIDPGSGRTNWTLSGVPAASATEVWPVGDRLLLLDASRQLWQVPLATGRPPARPLDTREHLTGAATPQVTALPDGRAAVSTDYGVLVYDAAGALVAADAALGSAAPDVAQAAANGMLGTGMLPPVAAEGVFVAVEVAQRDGESGYRVHLVDGKTGVLRSTRLLGGLDLPPRRVAVIDGKIVVTSGNNSVALSVPEEK